MDVNIEINNYGSDYIVKLEGSIDYGNSNVFDEKIKEIVSEANSIIFDMEKLEYISSAGIRVILYANNVLESKGGIKVKHLNDTVNEIFEVTGLEELIEK